MKELLQPSQDARPDRPARRSIWPRRLARGLVWCGLWSSLLAASAGAQYTAVEGSADAGVPDEEPLRNSLREARWSVGPFRFQPWLGLRDISWVSQQQATSEAEDESNDEQLTVTAGAGLRAYAPVGSKVIWAAHLLPEYVWWQDDESKEGLAGRYGMGLFGYANRLEFQASYRLAEQQQFFSDEVQELTTVATTTTATGLEVEVARGLHVYGSWQQEEFEGNHDDDAAFGLLDRTEDGWSAGLRLRSRRGWSVGFGTRQVSGEFETDARNLSFDSDAVTFDLQLSIRKFSLSLKAEETEFTPQPGSVLARSEVTLGNARLRFAPRDGAGLEVYSDRRRRFSVRQSSSLLVTEESGLRVALRRRAVGVRLFAGTGTVESSGVGAEAGASVDFDTWGASLGINFSRLGTLEFNVLQRTYDQALPGFGRDDVTSFGVSIQLGELARRLSVGESRSVW